MAKISFSIVKQWLLHGNNRSVKAKRNIALSFLFKFIDVVCSIVIVRLALEYVGETHYGIWLTLSSFITLFHFVDIGLGHGMRNKLSESLAVGNSSQAKSYVSTAYFGAIIIFTLFVVAFFITNHYANWYILLNVSRNISVLPSLVIVIFLSFAFRLVLSLISSVILAYQDPAINEMLKAAVNTTTLLGLFILIRTTSGSLMQFGMLYSFTPIVWFIIVSIVLYKYKYIIVSPKIKYIKIKILKSLFDLGIKFFIIQIAALVLYSSDNLIIAHLYSPAEVTPYHIAHRYFGIPMMVFAIVVSPLWSAITEAHSKKEYVWIRNAVNKLIKLWWMMLFVITVMLIVSSKVYSIWLGDHISIPFELSLIWSIYVLITALCSIYISVINGLGQINKQIYYGGIAAVVNIPMSILFAKHIGMGVVGVCFATAITQLGGLIIYSKQYYKYMQKNL